MADFLREEYDRAMREELTGDCSENCEHPCGICGEGIFVNRSICPNPPAPLPALTPRLRSGQAPGPSPEGRGEKIHVLFYYRRDEPARFIPIQDMARLFERALRIAGAPLAYSEGFSPHPRMSFFCALPLGCLGEREIFTAVFSAPVPEGLVTAMNARLPAGLAALSAAGMEGRTLSENDVTAAEYEILPVTGRYRENLAAFMAKESFQAGVRTKSGLKQVDLRKGVLEAGMQGDGLRVTLSSGPSRAIRVHDFLQHGLSVPMDEILLLQITRKKLILSVKDPDEGTLSPH